MSLIIKFVNNAFDEENSSELLIEIQGNLTHTIENKFNFMYLGKLNKHSEDSYTLNIGNHQIYGKRVNLKNSIMVCERFKDGGQIKIRIKKIIKDKILFNSRPTPILVADVESNNNSRNEIQI